MNKVMVGREWEQRVIAVVSRYCESPVDDVKLGVHYGPKGTVDVVFWDKPTGCLYIIECKSSRLVASSGRKHSYYARALKITKDRQLFRFNKNATHALTYQLHASKRAYREGIFGFAHYPRQLYVYPILCYRDGVRIQGRTKVWGYLPPGKLIAVNGTLFGKLPALEKLIASNQERVIV